MFFSCSVGMVSGIVGGLMVSGILVGFLGRDMMVGFVLSLFGSKLMEVFAVLILVGEALGWHGCIAVVQSLS